MIKRIIACLTICLIITGLLSPVFSDASALPQPNWSDPGISEIINISDLTGWMLNGGTFDVSQYTDAESFMNDYFNARTKTRLISPGEDAEDYYEVLPGFGINNQFVAGDSFARPLDTNRVIASSFRDHSGYGRRFSNKVNDALLSTGSLYDTKIPLLNEVEFANFVNYNHDALRLYSEFFDNQDSGPNIPSEYQVFCTNLSGLTVGGCNLLTANLAYNTRTWNNRASYSYYKSPTFSNGFVVDANSSINMYASDPITIYVNGNDTSGWNMSCNIHRVTPWAVGTNWRQLMSSLYIWDSNTFDFGLSTTSYSDSGLTSHSSDSLTTMLNWLNLHFRNVTLIVNNETWAVPGGNLPSSPSITPEFPDAVGGEDLPNTTWPISRPRAPYYTSVPGVLQAIEDAIADDGELDIDDLKPYLTDENGDPVPDPIFDPEPVPIPVPDPVNPDVVPGLPELPVMPLEMPGFNGVSVLAEIINFTNQSLPTALIVTFWGIVFGIVILGLIKILHK